MGRCLVIGAALAGSFGISFGAMGQLVPPAPREPTPVREYTPPPTRSAPPTAPGRPTGAMPEGNPNPAYQPGTTLIRLDGAGRIIPLRQHPDLAAVALLELDAERRGKVDDALADRRAEMTAIVRDGLSGLCALRSDIESATVDMQVRDLLAISNRARALAPQRPGEYLAKAGVLEVNEVIGVRRLASEYEAGVQKEGTDRIGHQNIGEMTFLAFSLQTRQATQELFGVMDDALLASAREIDGWEQTLELTREQATALDETRRRLGSAQDDAARTTIVRAFVCGVLTDAQRATLATSMGG